jgi:hypothetical protein
MKKLYNLNFNLKDKVTSLGSIESGGITIEKDKDFFITSTNNWELNIQDIENSNISELKPGKNPLLNDKKIYRYPKLNLPRQKFDLVKEKFNCKIVRDKTKADIHVISTKFLNSIFDFRWHGRNDVVSPRELLFAFKEMKEAGMLSVNLISEINLAFADLEPDSLIIVNSRYNYSHSTLENDISEKIYLIIQKFTNNKINHNRIITITPENAVLYNDLVNTNAEIIYDVDLSAIIDEDLAVIPNTDLEQTISMVCSGDRDNRSLALEMLANCNVEKSFDVLSYVYFWKYDWLKDTNNWNTVNVKTLKDRMKDYAGGHEYHNIHTFNKYIKLLSRDGKLTKFVADQTRKDVLEKCLGSMIGPGSETFKVDLDNIYYSDKYKDSIYE